MKISSNEISNLAGLSRLTLSDDELEQYSGEMTAIVGFVDELKSCKTKHIGQDKRTRLMYSLSTRNDKPSLEKVQEDELIIKQFPKKDGTSLSVPSVF